MATRQLPRVTKKRLTKKAPKNAPKKEVKAVQFPVEEWWLVCGTSSGAYGDDPPYEMVKATSAEAAILQCEVLDLAEVGEPTLTLCAIPLREIPRYRVSREPRVEKLED